jgi:hypothetical protein
MRNTILTIPEADSKFRTLTGLNQDEFKDLLEVFNAKVTHKQMHYTNKNVRRAAALFQESRLSSLFGSTKKLWFMLLYMKENPNQEYHAYLFGISQSKVSEWISYLTPVLESSLKELGFVPQLGDTFHYQENEKVSWLLVDVVETLVPRSTDCAVQKEEYSGKKKLHTQKYMAICEANQKIVYITNGFEGKTHDKTIWDDGQVEIEGGIALLADLGFLGIDKDYENSILPFKKPKDEELEPHKKKVNKDLASLRVKVEHAFAGVKRLKIIRNKIRLKTFEIRETMFRIAVAMHNMRVQYRYMKN